MPSHDGLGLDNVNDRAPIGPAVRQPDPEQAIGLAQARSFGASLVDRQLPAKRKILKDEAPAVGESQVEQSNEPENERNHCYQSARTADPVSREPGRKLFNLNDYVFLARDSRTNLQLLLGHPPVPASWKRSSAKRKELDFAHQIVVQFSEGQFRKNTRGESRSSVGSAPVASVV